MAFFNTTLVSGIQDISAILPLLGTEQVERHVGSALTGGFLYAAACPMSLFGSLGAVKIAFSILIATFHRFRRYPKKNWIGARWLADAGFSAAGDVACLIGSPEEYLFRRSLSAKAPTSNIYLAEEKLMSLMHESHIDNVDKLHIKIRPGLYFWNLNLFVFSLIFAGIGITPYIYLFNHFNPQPGDPPVWVYPMMRTGGTMVVVVFSQAIIQLRLLQILRSRIIFLSLAKLHDIYTILDMTPDEAKRPAEELIAQLKQRLANHSPLARDGIMTTLVNDSHTTLKTDLSKAAHTPVETNTSNDTRLTLETSHIQDSALTRLGTNLNDQEKKHHVSPSTTNFLIILGFITVIGGFSTIIGYVGSFTVVQSSSTNIGPLIWLVLEGALSLVRVSIWGFNPTIDDNLGLEFILEISPNEPLVTCINSEGEIEDERLLPLQRSNTFLREIASYIGPIQSFSWDSVSVYYTLTGATGDRQNNNGNRILYITVYDYKEQTSSFVVKIVHLNEATDWTFFKVKNAQWDVLQVSLGVEMKPHENILTNDPAFLERLKDHCNDVSVRLNSHDTNSEYQFSTNWSLVLQSSTSARLTRDDLGKLTDSDKKYLEHGDMERRARKFFLYSGWWNDSHMAIMREELSQERPSPRSGNSDFLAGEKLEINEIEHLLFTQSLAMEYALASRFKKAEADLLTKRKAMVEDILRHRQHFMIGTTDEKKILEDELEDENAKCIESRLLLVKKASLSRLSQQRTSAIARLEQGKYRNAYDDTVKAQWREPPDWETLIWKGDGDMDLKNKFQTFKKRFAKPTRDPSQGLQSGDDSKNSFAAARRRCEARWAALMYRNLTERKYAADLEEIKARVFDNLERQEDEKARESITSVVRVMRSKYIRFLDMSPHLIEQTRIGLQISSMEALDILLELIRYNEVTTVVTVSFDLGPVPELEERIVEVVSRMRNVTHYGGPGVWMAPKLPSLSRDRVSQRLKKGLPVITYNNIAVEDHYRAGNPYLVFRAKSFCTANFQVTSQGLTSKVVLLSHCGTRVHGRGDLTAIRITVKGVKGQGLGDGDIANAHFDEVYCKHLNHDNFVQQWVRIDNIEKGRYELKIELDESSLAAYWLDYVELADFDEAYHWRIGYPELKKD